MMKTVLMVAVMALSLQAADPIKTTDAEKLKTRELQLAVSNIERDMAQLQLRYKQTVEAQEQVAAALKANMAALQKAHKCDGCELDPRTLDLIRPAAAPKPEPAKGN